MSDSFIFQIDGYKLGHRPQYPDNTQYILANLTARSTRIEGADSCVFFGLQSPLKRDFIDSANRTFFSRPKSDVIYDYKKFVDNYLGENAMSVDHIAALHDLQYIPLEFRALPEGTHVPLRVPMFTVENTHPEFFWVTNYFETLLSSRIWQPCRSATIAYRYRKILETYATLTGGPLAFVDWQGHDFSFRGMPSPEAAAMSGAGHLLSFTGTDTIPAIQLLHDDYDGEGLIGCSVPATEHSVMCAGGDLQEIQTFSRLMKIYPKGVLSVVSDTWDLWAVLTSTLPLLKDEIMARDGKLVIRPDSGDPVLILTGDASATPGSPAHKGVIQLLWDAFGGTVNRVGCRELDSHIGAIYGDSITEARAQQICGRLKDNGFASTNVVFGIGSYTYQYGTRDDFGMAMKATWARINGKEHMLFKDPITDNGMKKSAKGRLVVINKGGSLQLVDNLTYDEWSSWNSTHSLAEQDQLQKVWRDSRFLKRTNLAEIRQRIRA